MNHNEARDVLSGADAPRPLPNDLRDELARLLSGADPIARLATSGSASASPSTADLAPVPVDLRDRLTASLLAGAMPSGLRRRLARALPGRTPIEARILSVAAVATAVLLLAGGLAFAGRLGDGQGPRVQVAAPTSTTTTDLPVVEQPLVTEPAPPTTVAAPPTTKRPRVRTPAPVLAAFRSCADLVAKTKSAALAVVGPYGIQRPSERSDTATRPLGATDGSATGASGEAAATVTPSFSDTNVQERGVDEPDIVKTDGRRILTLTRNTVRISRHDAEGLRVEGSFELPTDGFARALLLEGNRAIVFGDVNPPDSPPRKSEDGPWLRTVRPWSAIWVIDVTSASAMRVESTLYFDGRYADARMTGGRIRVVVNTAAVGPTFVTPTDGSQRASDEAERRNREVIERSTIDDWSPRYLRLDGTDRSSGRWGRLCACDRVLRPDEFSGLGNITVLTIDPANPDPADATAVQGAGQTVYASAANLYATSRGWGAVGETTSAPTAVHRFDITGLQRARYIGSASVRGALLSQFALSEHEGHLRVATTEYRWGDPDGATRTDNLVTVLALRDGGLETVGQIAGLGARGETIRAVRFIGALGYLVTFRQTDPLYVLDFSAPEKPVLRGELKTPGFSAYLHPTEEGFLLGVGWDADEEGRWRGEQVSTFDVRNPEQPTQVDHFAFGANSTSEVQRDHHAFLYWALTRTAVIPVERYSNEGNWAGAFVMRLDADHKLVEVGRVTHTAREQRGNALTTVRRSLVIGDNLYTMSDAGLLASDINTAADRAWLPF